MQYIEQTCQTSKLNTLKWTNRQTLEGRVHCFSLQLVMNKCFLLNPEKKSADPSCRFREKCKKRTFNSEKGRHRAEGLATLITG